MRIHESKKIKIYELIASILLFIIGIVCMVGGNTIIGFYFVGVGVVAIAWAIGKIKRGLLCVELNSDNISIPYKIGIFPIKWKTISLRYEDILMAKKQQGLPRNGYVPTFLAIVLKNGDILTLALPSLTIDLDCLIKLINENINQFPKS